MSPIELPHIHFTLGPASFADDVLRQLLQTEAQVCRVNLSHTQPDELGPLFNKVRSAARELNRPIAVGADIRSRKLRLGRLPLSSIQLQPKQRFRLEPMEVDQESMGGQQHASVNCPVLSAVVTEGDLILLDDGMVQLRVLSTDSGGVDTRVEIGGPLPERCGVNVPNRPIELSPLTPKDVQDLDALAELKPELVYLSFVETADDIEQLRAELAQRNLSIPIVAKIERALALQHIEQIARSADFLCLARGDLGVEVELAQLPLAQRQVVAAAASAKTPVLLAGEVLYSMVNMSRPTRAEVTDIFVAMEQGCAGFILSDETAQGQYPAAAVRWLHKIAVGALANTRPSRADEIEQGLV